MYLSKVTIENFGSFGEGPKRFELSLRPGLTALVGENDAGKTAVIDALRLVLGTTDQEWYHLEETDFHAGEEGACREMKIICKFDDLLEADQRAFLECLTYGEGGGAEPVLCVHLTAKDSGETHKDRTYRRFETHSGKAADGPALAQNARGLLSAIYLRPLRDAGVRKK